MNGTALITGGAKRIGKQIALYLADQGYNIALHYNTSTSEADETRKEILQKSRKCEVFQYDLKDENNISKLINDVTKQFSDLNILLNNASIFQEASFIDTTTNFFNEMFLINFKAPFFLTKEFAKYAKKGNVINFLDTRISKNRSKYFIYTLTKKTLEDFTKMAALELAPDIKVNAIAPGFVLPPDDCDKDIFEQFTRKLPLQKNCSIKDLFNAISYILNNSSITGQTLFLDGGESL